MNDSIPHKARAKLWIDPATEKRSLIQAICRCWSGCVVASVVIACGFQADCNAPSLVIEVVPDREALLGTPNVGSWFGGVMALNRIDDELGVNTTQRTNDGGNVTLGCCSCGDEWNYGL